MTDFWTQGSYPKARKQYQCVLCYRQIEAGEVYRKGSGVYDGSWFSWRECAHCDAVWNLYRPEDSDGLISESGYDAWVDSGTYWRARALTPEETLAATRELRHRAQYRRRWRRHDGQLYPIPTPHEGTAAA